jgi:dTDP-4-dehydrorhamnose 3,5-epimerase
MILHQLSIPGPCLVEPERHLDERGFFARMFAATEFDEAGLDPGVVECSVSFNTDRATLRGMHLQKGRFAEAKLIRCTRGRIWDVVVDVRPASPTFGAWVAAELGDESRRAMYAPRGFAHGFVTLEPQCEVFYQCSQPYREGASTGFRWNDPDASITWPLEPETMSTRDRNLPSLAQLRVVLEEEQ